MSVFDYCSEKTRLLLTSAAYVHLKQFDISKHTRNLAPASKAILLSGPAGKTIYHPLLCSNPSLSVLIQILCNFGLVSLFSAEFYQQMLAKALAHYFESKLLLLDVTDFSIKVTLIAYIVLVFCHQEKE